MTFSLRFLILIRNDYLIFLFHEIIPLSIKLFYLSLFNLMSLNFSKPFGNHFTSIQGKQFCYLKQDDRSLFKFIMVKLTNKALKHIIIRQWKVLCSCRMNMLMKWCNLNTRDSIAELVYLIKLQHSVTKIPNNVKYFSSNFWKRDLGNVLFGFP